MDENTSNDMDSISSGHRVKKILSSKKFILLALLLFFSFSLNFIGNEWGLTGFSTWQPDTIEGDRTVTNMQFLFKTWRHKYPRGQYFINAIFYYPVLKRWEKNPVTLTDASGQRRLSALSLERLVVLAEISRWIMLFMNLGTIIAVFLTAYYLLGDYLSAFLAGFTISFSNLFVFYSSFGHVDVPFVFWFAWSGYFAVRAIYEQKWLHIIPAALFGAYAVCTKDAYGGYVIGLGLTYLILISINQYKDTKDFIKILKAVFSIKLLVATIIFVALCLIMNGFLSGPDEFLGRLKTWNSDKHFYSSRTQLSLLRSAYRGLHTGLGWPLLILLAAGIINAAIRRRKLLILSLVPLIVFYLVTVVRIHFVADRFMLAAYVGFSLLIGSFLADWIRLKRIPFIVRYSSILVLLALTVFYCIGLKLDMKYDARIRAEKWFHNNVSKDKIVGAALGGGSAPRIGYQGYKQIFLWNSKGIPTSKGSIQFFPDYLIMSQKVIPRETKFDHAFRKELYAGQTMYKLVASFDSLYFDSPYSIYSLAVWPYQRTYLVSIPVDIFKKQ
ncbi:MAG: glycosyltransferase family 39 protein [Phycisphaerae bacterium]|nr:glycosyltransferase family 39 protein [Phycisphaerae bacterium]